MDILLTGANGFLGRTIQKVLKENVILTLARSQANIVCNLVDAVPDLPQVDLVIHAAGRAHTVPKKNEEKLAFFEVNVKGTKNLLDALTRHLPKAFVFISSVAVYGKEQGEQIDEESPLQATDSYGKSKIEAEQLILDWCKIHRVTCTILRLPLLVGSNPPGNLGAMIKAIKKGYYLNIGGGKAKKSMVLAQDVSAIIPQVAKIGGIYNLTDGVNPSFRELEVFISKAFNKSNPVTIPLGIAKIFGRIGDLFGNQSIFNSDKLNKMTSSLTFNDTKAITLINWNPSPVLGNVKNICD